MKTILCMILVASVLFPARSLLAQGGALTPPGAPAPTMLSLDEMEPRTPLIDGAPGVSVAASGTITIARPGSYYLTGNVTVTSGSGITISVDGVTLDLRASALARIKKKPCLGMDKETGAMFGRLAADLDSIGRPSTHRVQDV